jgi:hypothetical protein
MQRLLRFASPTYNWPEAIHTRSLSGSAGDGQHGWASAEWLLLVRALLLREDDRRLTLAPALPHAWLSTPGHLSVDNAPTRFGPLSYHLEWDQSSFTLDLASRTTAPEVVWHLPIPARQAIVDDTPTAFAPSILVLPPAAKRARLVI